MLIDLGLLTAEQLEHALEDQRRTGRRLGRVLVDAGLIGENKLTRTLAEQLGIGFADLRTLSIDRALAHRLPEQHARRFRALVLGATADGGLQVGMADPTDLQAYDDLARVLNCAIEPVALAESDLLTVIDRVYQTSDGLTDLARELKADLAPDASMLALMGGAGPDDTTPVARLLGGVFEDAVRARASDIHFEPQAEHLHVRLRVDGVLRSHTKFDADIASAVLLRLKLISNLDIAEKRMPQDGRFEVTVRGVQMDMRISIMPSYWGESAVLRLLETSPEVSSIERMGLPPHVERQVRHAIGRPNGMIVVTGPTGSGKSTTLYALLGALANDERKLVTVEDPIEYRLPGITQIQVNERIELNFARVLRSVLRHDPDVVMVGEMRDTQTAEIGVRAAMTGHLMLSTLHTNDAASTPARLADMGIPNYMLATSLQLILAQRLVRRVCESCSRPASPTPQEHAWLATIMGETEAAGLQLKAGAGCPQCADTGYSGRAGIYESVEITRRVADALLHDASEGFRDAVREQLEGRQLVHDAVRLLRSGVTTVAEAMRVTALPVEEA